MEESENYQYIEERENYPFYLHYDIEDGQTISFATYTVSINYGITEKEFWKGILNAYGDEKLKLQPLEFLISAIQGIKGEFLFSNFDEVKQQLKTTPMWRVLKNYFYDIYVMDLCDVAELDEKNGEFLKDYYEQDAYDEYNEQHDCSDRIEFYEV